MTKSKPQPEHLTIEQAAELLGVHQRTVYRLVQTGKLTPQRSTIGRGKGGRRVYFDRAQVEALKAGMIEPGE